MNSSQLQNIPTESWLSTTLSTLCMHGAKHVCKASTAALLQVNTHCWQSHSERVLCSARNCTSSPPSRDLACCERTRSRMFCASENISFYFIIHVNNLLTSRNNNKVLKLDPFFKCNELPKRFKDLRCAEQRRGISWDVVQMGPHIKSVNHVVGVSLPWHPLEKKIKI